MKRNLFTFVFVNLSIVALLLFSYVPSLQAKEEMASNLALNKPVTVSSDTSVGKASNAVDGDYKTYWQPLAADRADGNVWITVDLESRQSFNTLHAMWNRTDNIGKYEILYSDDGETWKKAFEGISGFNKDEQVSFDTVTARYVKLDITLSRNLNLQTFELAIYQLEEGEDKPINLTDIYFVDDSGKAYSENAFIDLNKGETNQLQLKGKLKSGEEVDLTEVKKQYHSSTPNVTIDLSGKVTAIEVGASMVTAKVELADGKTLTTPYIWLYIHDPEEFFDESYVAHTDISHPNMKMEIGQPAVLEPKDDFPTLNVRANVSIELSGEVVKDGEDVVAQIPQHALAKDEKKDIVIAGKIPENGQYEIRLTLQEAGKNPVYDTFYFTALQQGDIPEGQSSIVFLNDDHRLTYVPDYKGNRVLDFSNSGYMGGGVTIPNVKVAVTVEPVDGDATQIIQEAIDRVAKLPIDKDGFRGAVLLKKGRYNIGGTLHINESGVVLRGEGGGEDGTLIYGTGSERRNLIEIGSGSGPSIDSASAETITDLYVPSGNRTFHVGDASAFNVGDSVMVRRVGNARWISEIGMDRIFMRPGVTSGTNQWAPFNLDFDRVITAIDGNEITIDAPIANAIDHKWGGGQLMKYSDVSRIEQVGVENMRADSDFDPSITDTVMDNGKTDPYYADEDHAERFVVFNSVKNGWARHLSATHMSYSLVQMSRNAKWITVEDSTATDFISIITGGRRYANHLMGQLSLVQRVHVETARHAFVVDSRVQGPNVVLDSSSAGDYNTSEPHHRWSVGGLFDNVKAKISIRDRAWLGSGHGWAGANYVTWNTEGDLTSQQPPTAQNYAIGHVGPVVAGLVPNNYDSRPRSEGYWESTGKHVTLASLYKQQLMERLIQEEGESANTILKLVELVHSWGDIEDKNVARTLETHLTALEHFENQGESEKVIKHVKGLKQLLDHQQKDGGISEQAYNMLQDGANSLLKKWQ